MSKLLVTCAQQGRKAGAGGQHPHAKHMRRQGWGGPQRRMCCGIGGRRGAARLHERVLTMQAHAGGLSRISQELAMMRVPSLMCWAGWTTARQVQPAAGRRGGTASSSEQQDGRVHACACK